MADTINILLTTFPGLNLPSTLSIPLCADLPINAFTSLLASRLPFHANNLILTTTSNHQVDPLSASPLSSLSDDTLLPLHLTSSLPGGKGGFGSQLRAAGGRMSSRKNRNNNRDPNASSRNLDGRRLRTVTEAKALAEYLATKPEMDKKEREEKRARWESIVEAAEKRDEEIRNGRKGARLDGEWVERKEEEEGKTREAVLAMMKAELEEGRTGSESDEEAEGEDMEVDVETSGSGSGSGEEVEEAGGKSFYGWDEEDLSSDEEDDEVPAVAAYEGKGKAKAV
ncbi:putative telomere maintenance protein SDE2 [Elsinoe fawcettii]|nr:putative telomere maintenance protein SDE2 [Elsinoe fawcettii]